MLAALDELGQHGLLTLTVDFDFDQWLTSVTYGGILVIWESMEVDHWWM